MEKRIAVLVVSVFSILMSLAIAHVITFFPIVAQVSPTAPKVVFGYGSNSNQPDVDSNITVNIYQGTRLELAIHPTYETTYYENISVINNTDTKAWTVTLKVVQPLTNLPTDARAYLYIYDSGATRTFDYSNFAEGLVLPTGYLYQLDLTQTSSLTFTINPGTVYEIDVLVYIPDNETLPSSGTAVVSLEASP